MSTNWLLRIDERLIHGQVVLGCCLACGVRRMVLCDDSIAGSDFEMELYRLGIEADQRLEFLTVTQTAERLKSPPEEDTLVVMRSPAVALELLRLGAPLGRITVGGLHYRSGARRLLDFIHVTAEDESALRALVAEGVTLEARQVPSSDGTNLANLL